jgi:putative oligomerization/nucleic acid binding protein/phospholipase D-like protein
MLLAADYPFLNIFWTMIIFFCWVAWIWTLIVIFSDLFSRHDRSGWYKAFWMVGLIILPFLGVLIYLIANGTGMGERRLDRARAQQAHFDEYVQSVASSGSNGSAAEIAQAKELLDSGAITQAEFDKLKAKALA